jgi:hypothetical protein
LTFFNGHYDTWCYLPVAGFLTFNEEPEQYLFAYVLRPGNVGASVGALGILSRLLPKLRAAFPRARLRVRLDGGFAAPQIFAFLDREGVEYAVAMGKNKVLERRAARLMGTARRLSRESGETEHLYTECRYAAGTWDYPRRVVIKAEVVRHPGRKPKNNPRFVVTNLKHSPRHLYEQIYCARANVENRIKELHHGLQIDRTSCTRFLANQLRAMLTAAAYALYQELRLRAARTALGLLVANPVPSGVNAMLNTSNWSSNWARLVNTEPIFAAPKVSCKIDCAPLLPAEHPELDPPTAIKVVRAAT